jgi:hypothetical protein
LKVNVSITDVGIRAQVVRWTGALGLENGFPAGFSVFDAVEEVLEQIPG